ncbi:MAG: hypothetical protein FIB06_04590 [Betaproteobacteria bacterium]|nr:hypothetical protein [Betaproteobacteria bacterium]
MSDVAPIVLLGLGTILIGISLVSHLLWHSVKGRADAVMTAAADLEERNRRLQETLAFMTSSGTMHINEEGLIVEREQAIAEDRARIAEAVRALPRHRCEPCEPHAEGWMLDRAAVLAVVEPIDEGNDRP